MMVAAFVTVCLHVCGKNREHGKFCLSSLEALWLGKEHYIGFVRLVE